MANLQHTYTSHGGARSLTRPGLRKCMPLSSVVATPHAEACSKLLVKAIREKTKMRFQWVSMAPPFFAIFGTQKKPFQTQKIVNIEPII